MKIHVQIIILKLALSWWHGISQESAAATTDHFADVYVHDMMDTLLRNEWNDFFYLFVKKYLM